jgi:NADH-quinone oxidoreductase subunit H
MPLIGIKLLIIILCYYFEFLNFIAILLPVILSIAFFTVLERKILASIQRRRGPNMVGIYGILQAIADAIKLLNKETNIPSLSNNFIFLIAPLFTIILSFLSWAVIPFDFKIVISDANLGILFLFAISSMNVYGILISGWASNSKYAFLGCLRSASQLISYEISIGLIILPVLLFAQSANLSNIVLSQSDLFFIIPLFPSFLLFFISALAETNRIPFDLPEAESELVSGYNVEYSSIVFVFFFLAEYSNIILISALMTILFFGGWLPILNILNFIPGWIWFSGKMLFLMYAFVWIRGTLPRYRFDQLMFLGWKVILPLSLSLVFLTFGLISLFIKII